jgi:hypothetical protein
MQAHSAAAHPSPVASPDVRPQSFAVYYRAYPTMRGFTGIRSGTIPMRSGMASESIGNTGLRSISGYSADRRCRRMRPFTSSTDFLLYLSSTASSKTVDIGKGRDGISSGCKNEKPKDARNVSGDMSCTGHGGPWRGQRPWENRRIKRHYFSPPKPSAPIAPACFHPDRGSRQTCRFRATRVLEECRCPRSEGWREGLRDRPLGN